MRRLLLSCCVTVIATQFMIRPGEIIYAAEESYSDTQEEAGDHALEPEVTIRSEGGIIHEEYRINGRLYMIKIIPAKGPPYYLMDYEGNGRFRRSDLEPQIAIPNWVIKRF